MTTLNYFNLDENQLVFTLVQRVDFFIGKALKQKDAQHLSNPSPGTIFPDSDLVLADYDQPRVQQFAAALNLSEFDLDLIAFALAPELDRRYSDIYAYLQSQNNAQYLTIDAALKILWDDPQERLARRQHFSSYAPLIAQKILQLIPPQTQISTPFINHYLVLDEQFKRFILQEISLDSRLQDSCQFYPPQPENPAILPTEQQQSLINFLQDYSQQEKHCCLYLQGNYPVSQQQIALGISSGLNLVLLTVDLDVLLEKKSEFKSLISLILREAWLQNTLLYFSALDILWQPENHQSNYIFQQAIATHRGIILLAGKQPWQPSEQGSPVVLTLPIHPPEYPQRLRLWENALNQADLSLSAEERERLSYRYRLNPSQIAQAVAIAQQQMQWQIMQGKTPDLFLELCAAARQQTGHSLQNLAKKIDLPYTWNDVILKPEILAQLQAVQREAEYRELVHGEWGFAEKLALGKGLNILFVGSSGIGKTMTAAVLANHLQLDLYKIDLSQIVSKYIGETEKNLSKIFTAATDSNAILLFDEADALFGKRSEVQDAHDRYANIEVSYLLQQMEEYEGITILTTNLRNNIDPAFERRLRFIIEFSKPDVGDRLKLWQQVFPKNAPLNDDIDWQFLASKFDLTGANIKNIALTAAFAAAESKTKISMQEIIFALKGEYQKIGQILRDKDLGDYGNLTR